MDDGGMAARGADAGRVAPNPALGSLRSGPGGSATIPVDDDWFVVRVTTAATSPDRYLFVEQWLDTSAAWADKDGGRFNTANDYAYPIGGTLAVGAKGLCRRAMGNSGAAWELVPLPRNPSHARLTEATGAASGYTRYLDGSFAWQNGTLLADVIYPVQISNGGNPVAAFTPYPTACGLVFKDADGSNSYAFLPIQTATSGYAGYIAASGVQTLSPSLDLEKSPAGAATESRTSYVGYPMGSSGGSVAGRWRLGYVSFPYGATAGDETDGVGLAFDSQSALYTPGVVAWTGDGSTGALVIRPGHKTTETNTPGRLYLMASVITVVPGATSGGARDGVTATEMGLEFVNGIYVGGSSTAGSGTVTSVGLNAPAAGITVSGSPVTGSGSMTLALADDLAALEALSGTDTIYYRSGTSTWSAVTIGAGLSFSGGTLDVAGGGGGVLGTADGGTGTDMSATGPGVVLQSTTGGGLSAYQRGTGFTPLSTGGGVSNSDICTAINDLFDLMAEIGAVP